MGAGMRGWSYAFGFVVDRDFLLAQRKPSQYGEHASLKRVGA
jgi:hypothetical protein